MAAYAVIFSAEAAKESVVIAAWWVANRPAAPRLFTAELRAALLKLSVLPEKGTPTRIPGVRSALLRRSGYVVFYEVEHEAGLIKVLRIRHTRRKPLRSVRSR